MVLCLHAAARLEVGAEAHLRRKRDGLVSCRRLPQCRCMLLSRNHSCPAGVHHRGVGLPPLPEAVQLQQLPEGAPSHSLPLHLRLLWLILTTHRKPCPCVCPAHAPGRVPADEFDQQLAGEILMQKSGLQATGILANISKAAGFQSVSALLQQNPHAQVRSARASCWLVCCRPALEQAEYHCVTLNVDAGLHVRHASWLRSGRPRRRRRRQAY